MDRKQTLEKVDVREVLSRLGVEVRDSSGSWATCRCPLPTHPGEDRNPSFRIALEADDRHEKGFWKCHTGCGARSLFDLVIELAPQVSDFEQALSWLGVAQTPQGLGGAQAPQSSGGARAPQGSGKARGGGKVRRAPPRWRDEKPSDFEQIETHVSQLLENPEALEYLTDTRGIDHEVLAKAQIGYSTRCGKKDYPSLTIPYPTAKKGERPKVKHFGFPKGGSGPRCMFFPSGGSKPPIYAPFPVRRDEPILVFESEWDALLAISYGVQAVAAGGIERFKVEWFGAWIEDGFDLIFVPDLDDAGKKRAEFLSNELSAEYPDTEHRIAFVAPPGGKDLGDVWQKTGSRDDVLNEIRRLLASESIKPDWRNRLRLTKDGTIHTTSAENLRIIVKEMFGHRLWKNEMGEVRCIDDRRIRDEDYVDMWCRVEQDLGVTMSYQGFTRVVARQANERRRHPVKEYLESLEWDGTLRIDSVTEEMIGLAPTEDRELASAYFKNFMVSAVARGLKPGTKVDNMLVLYSQKQGIGKSRMLRALAGEWFRDISVSFKKDCLMSLHQCWINEVAELDASMRKNDLSEFRHFLSATEDHIRLVYERETLTFPRGFVLVATTNEPGLVGEYDGRRYWPIEVVEVDVDSIARARDQLWAEAVVRYRKGERWWLNQSMEARRRERVRESFEARAPAHEVILDWITDDPQAWREGMTNKQIRRHLDSEKVPVPPGPNSLPATLRRCGLDPAWIWNPEKGCSARGWKLRGEPPLAPPKS